MAVNSRRIFPLRQAQQRRGELPRYLRLDGSRYLLGAVLILCLVSLIALGQTGLVATKGYAIAQLEQQRIELLRERSQLQLRLAAAKSLERIERRASELGLRPLTREQSRYITVPPTAGQSPPAAQKP
jgi:hypothetical protein